MKKILSIAMMVAAMVAQGSMNVVTNQLGEIGNDEYVVTSITGAAIETNEVNALILAYDMTNLTVRFNGKLDLPPMLAPTNWIPVSIGNGRAEWMPNMGGGGGSLGSVNYITDADGKCYPVYATTNSEGKVIQVVGQIPIAPMKKTVEQEEFRAVTAETLLYTNALAETAQRIATDNMLLDKINAISALGRLISTWDCETGRPTTEPLTETIAYKSGDYYLVGKVATNAVNYIPHGTTYTRGQQSTTPALDDVYVNDVYRHTEDGSWVHTVMAGVMVRWEQIDGNPTNNHHFVETVNDLSFSVVTQTVDKAYVESLGIDVGISTAAVERIVVQYDATNLSSRIEARVSKPDETVPAGYSLVRGVTNLTEWVMLPGTNIVGYLGYIRDETNGAHRVIAQENPEGQFTAAIEQQCTPMEIITIEEERLARIAGDIAGTNYTDNATNALSLALVPRIVEAAEAGTNYTDAATLAVTNWVKGTFLPLSGGTVTGNIYVVNKNIYMGSDENAPGITTDFAGNALGFYSNEGFYFTHKPTGKSVTLYADNSDVLTEKNIKEKYPVVTNAYAYTDAATNRVAGMIADEAALRASGDTALSAAIANEAALRETGDNDLDAKITVEKDRAEGQEALLNIAITNEAALRASGDAVLQTNIGIETTRATVNETALGRRIDALVDGTNTVAEMVRTEKTRAETEEAGLQANITAEATARAEADALLIPLAQKGVANGVATLDGTGKVPVAQIPNSVRPIWGYITGTMANQTDIAAALDAKQEKLPDAIPDYYLHSNYDTGELEWKAVTGGGGTGNYNELTNKPKIENHLLSGGNNTAASLGLQTNLVVDLTVANKVLKNDGSTLFWGSGGGGGGEDCIPITKTVASATDIKNLFELAFEKSWDDIPQNSSMIVYATGLPYADNTFPNSEGYCVLRYRTYRYAYIEFICPTVAKNGTKFNKMQNGTWKGWTDPPLPVFNIKNPTSYMDLFNKMGYSYGMDGFTASGIATGLNIDPAKGDYFPHPNCYVTVSSLNNACYRIQASGFNQTGVLWERREESGDWRPWTRIDGNVSQKTIWGDYKDCDNIFLEAFCATNSQPDKATITGYAYNLNTAIFPEMTGFLTMRQVDSNNKQIEFRSINPDTPVKYNSKTNGVWTGWKVIGGSPTDTLILNGNEDIITGPYVIPHGYGESGQILVSKGENNAPEWSDQPLMVLNGTITNAIGPVVIPGGYGLKGNLLVGNGDSSPTWIANGTAGNILVSGGADADPSWKGLETAAITREGTSSGSLIVRKIGRFCSISVNQLASTSGGSGTAALVGTISGTSYLPTDDYFGVSITPINGGTAAYLLIRNESSTMKVYIKGHSSGTKYYGSGFYITK